MNFDLQCRICSSKNINFRFSIRKEDIWHCNECGFEQVRNMPNMETLEDIYSEKYFTNSKYSGDTTALKREDKRRLNILREWVNNGANILDAGCSTGDFISHVKNQYKMYGIDFSEYAVRIAQKRNPEMASRIRSCRIEDAPWGDQKFDAICLWDVVEHIWDPISVISEMHQHLEPGGVILISTPAIDSTLARLLGPIWPFMTPPEHLSFFSYKSFQVCVNKIKGCEIVYHSRKGKWANLAFIAYKVKKVAPKWFPGYLVKPLQFWPLNKITLYVPTYDVQYVVIKKIIGGIT